MVYQGEPVASKQIDQSSKQVLVITEIKKSPTATTARLQGEI